MNKLTMIVTTLALVAGCKGRDKASSREQMVADNLRSSNAAMDKEEAPMAGEGMALDEGQMEKKDLARDEAHYAMKTPAAAPMAQRLEVAKLAEAAGVLGSEDISSGFDANGRYGTIGHGSGTGAGYGVGGGRRGGKGGPGGAAAETSVRAWFPETFLFEPLVVTDDNGRATVPVRVPDRLTTWRILALAHSRQGSQGGATTSFLGTLPTYVDLVVPKFLVVGDRIKLPVQIVNTTDAAVSADLSIDVQGATVTGGSGRATVPAQGNVVQYVTLEATKPGKIVVQAGLGGTDAVRREIEVRPAGRPETVTRTGTLAEPRTITVEGPTGSDPATDRVRLLVYPGALALLRTELGVSTARTGVADDAYALLLAGKATSLLASLGDKADPDAVRNLSILTGQRAIRDGRTLDVDRAGLLVEAALAHKANPILARLGERAAQFLAEHQRPDGTFAGGQGWTLQRMLIATADAVRAVNTAVDTTEDRQRAQGVTLRAASAFERTSEQVTDAYTAAAILA
ncbi:MAG TPA: alpha-2-macroglobulin family protein, partial [Kofleriaceae bacterium]